MYTTKEVLKKLGISKPTLYKICKQKGLKPQLVGKHYRYTDENLKQILSDSGYDTRKIEDKFVEFTNDIWFILVKFANEIWSENGEEKLKEIMLKNKENLFIMNISKFKENTNV